MSILVLPEPVVKVAAVNEPSEHDLRREMKHHGVLYSLQDEQGRWWGVRPTGERFQMFRERQR